MTLITVYTDNLILLVEMFAWKSMNILFIHSVLNCQNYQCIIISILFATQKKIKQCIS